MRLLNIANTALLGLLATVYATSIELTPDNIQSLTGSGTWLIEHFSPSCSHCKQFAPDWKRLTEDLTSLETESDFHFGTIDCTVRGDLCQEHGIMAYPTLQLYHQGEFVERYPGANQYDPLTEYIYDKIASFKSSTEESISNEEGEGEDIEEEEEGDDDQEEGEEEDDDNVTVEEVEEEEEGDALVSEQAISEIVLPNPEGLSVDIDEAKMKEIEEGNVAWFVKFYAPWCGHCKALAPTWVELAKQLKNQVNIGEVNCVTLPSLCTQYGIQGFPTLKMMMNEKEDKEIINYSGDRSLASLQEFAVANNGPLIKEVQSIAKLNSYLAVKDVSIIYFSKQQKVPDMIESIAKKYKNVIPFYSIHDEEVFKKYNVALNSATLMITKDNSYDIYTGDLSNKEKVINWIEKEQYPLISKLGPSNHKSILQGNLPVIIHIVGNQDTINQSKFRNIATAWFKGNNDKVIFAEMDNTMWRNYIQDKFSIDSTTSSSKLVLYDASTFQYYTNDMSGNELSLNKQEDIFTTVKNLDKLSYGKSTLAIHERVVNQLQWMMEHWIISFAVLTIVGSFIYRYFTLIRPKRQILPSHNKHNKD